MTKTLEEKTARPEQPLKGIVGIIPYNPDCLNPEVTISFGKNRDDTNWRVEQLFWSEFADKLRTVRRTSETMAVYDNMTKPEQGKAKDGPGYVGGPIKDGRRKKENIEGRSVITFDADFYGKEFYSEYAPCFGGSCLDGIAYALYPTHSHREARQKYRLPIPTDRPMSPDEHSAVSRWVGQQIGMRYLDKASFRINQLMYMPSCSADAAEIRLEVAEGAPIAVDAVLAKYEDWTDVSSWPRHPEETAALTKHVGQLSDPRESSNKVIAAFNTAYAIPSVLEKYLPDKYERVTDNRYTYTGGSSSGGMRIYAEKNDPSYDAWAFSEHTSDPANTGHCLNSFDLGRAHLYGHLDDGVSKFTNDSKRPSYQAMLDRAAEDPKVKMVLIELRKAEIDEFGEPPVAAEEADDAWVSKLELNRKTGAVKVSARNAELIMENDPRLKGKIALDTFGHKVIKLGVLPWENQRGKGVVRWSDEDEACLRIYLSKAYGLTNKSIINDAVIGVCLKNEFHPVLDYLKGLTWDGVPRIDTWLIDYFGVEDTELNRAIGRKTLAAAVNRVYEPGCVYQYVLALLGPQGRGKSLTLAQIFSREWFTDSLVDLDKKDALEQLHSGKWCFELGEMAATKRIEVLRMKQFLANPVDNFRHSFGKYPKDYARQNIFIATTNEDMFLKDPTGGRRFWIVEVKRVCTPEERILIPRDQLWAEAVQVYRAGELLYLPDNLESEAEKTQSEHTNIPVYADVVLNELDELVPESWANKTKYERRYYVNERGSPLQELGIIQRQRVCAAEIVCEILGQNDMLRVTRAQYNDIASILIRSGVWEKEKGKQKCGPWGSSLCFRRKK